MQRIDLKLQTIRKLWENQNIKLIFKRKNVKIIMKRLGSIDKLI